MIEEIRKYNPDIQIHHINDSNFTRYGKIINDFDFTGLIDYLDKHTQVPQQGNQYVASDENAERLEVKSNLENWFYGRMPLEIGYCNGHNQKLNALEYHKGSEIDVAVTPSVLLLGSITDIKEEKIQTRDLEAFYIEQGMTVELYGTTLHFSPCEVTKAGFKMGIILPKGTNEAIDLADRRDLMLWMRNKWLYAHPLADHLITKGAYQGIEGKMLEIIHG